MQKLVKQVLFLTILTVTMFSCTSKRQLLYQQNINSVNLPQKLGDYEPVYNVDDLLMILVTSENPEAAVRFNMLAFASDDNMNEMISLQKRQLSYLVDKEGYINYPVLGKIKVAGLRKSEFIQLLETKLKQYINNPIISIRLTNFEINVLGEVNRPGTYTFGSEKVTLIDALAKAGDLTIYGNRRNVRIVRDINGVVTTATVNLTDANFFNSPYYYIKQNDYIYVESNTTRVVTTALSPIVTYGSVFLSTAITLYLLINK